MNVFFEITIKDKYTKKEIIVRRSATLSQPKNNSIMFVTEKHIDYSQVISQVKECLVFWPKSIEIPEEYQRCNIINSCDNPRFEYCRFLKDNNVTFLPKEEIMNVVNGAHISPNAVIGENVKIYPFSYIGEEVTIGNNVYIGSGAKLFGKIVIGNDVIIRENVVVGADGLAGEKDENGRTVTMPQFGGVFIEDEVQIGANCVVCRGTIDNTVVKRGSKIDNCCFISHNVVIGEDTLIVGETIMFGSSSTGNQAYISGNSTIRNGVHIGDNALVGMGSVVVKSVPDNSIVKGNPAK